MKRSAPADLSGLLQRVITGLDLEPGLRPFRVMQVWSSVAGERLGPHTRVTGCRGGVVFVEARSAVFQQEVAMSKTRLVEGLRKAVPGLFINDVRVRLGGGFPSISAPIVNQPSAKAIASAVAELPQIDNDEVRDFVTRARAAQREFGKK